MSNTTKPLPLEPALAELQAKGFDPQGPLAFILRTLLPRVDKVLTDLGEVRSVANVSGRTEPLSSTLQNVTSAGQLSTADAIAADGTTYGRVSVNALTTGNVDMSKSGVTNKTTDNLTDGTGSPLTGGKRGFQALDANNRLANSFRQTAVNTTCANTASTSISNDGSSTLNTIAASTFQFAPGTVSYNSGSYDPGGFGTTYAVTSDPTFSGGALSVSFSSTPPNQANAEANVIVGKISTVSGTPSTGGGYTKGGTRGVIS